MNKSSHQDNNDDDDDDDGDDDDDQGSPDAANSYTSPLLIPSTPTASTPSPDPVFRSPSDSTPYPVPVFFQPQRFHSLSGSGFSQPQQFHSASDRVRVSPRPNPYHLDMGSSKKSCSKGILESCGLPGAKRIFAMEY